MRKIWTEEELIAFENHIKELFLAKKITCPIHLCGGNESHLIALFEMVKDIDYVFSTHRNHYHYLLKGGSPKKLEDEIYGLPSGVCGGQGRSMHVYDKSINFITSGIVSGNCAMAVGVGLAVKKKFAGKSNPPHIWCFCGDGAEDSGHFAEAIRFAEGRKLPVTFIIEDNDLAVDTTKERRWHNHIEMKSGNIIRYNYTRTYPHVGVGEHVTF